MVLVSRLWFLFKSRSVKIIIPKIKRFLLLIETVIFQYQFQYRIRYFQGFINFFEDSIENKLLIHFSSKIWHNDIFLIGFLFLALPSRLHFCLNSNSENKVRVLIKIIKNYHPGGASVNFWLANAPFLSNLTNNRLSLIDIIDESKKSRPKDYEIENPFWFQSHGLQNRQTFKQDFADATRDPRTKICWSSTGLYEDRKKMRNLGPNRIRTRNLEPSLPVMSLRVISVL